MASLFERKSSTRIYPSNLHKNTIFSVFTTTTRTYSWYEKSGDFLLGDKSSANATGMLICLTLWLWPWTLFPAVKHKTRFLEPDTTYGAR